MKCVFSCCERVSRLDPQLAGIVRFGLKLIRHMWKASLPDVGLNKSVRHEPKRTIPANWGPRQETLPQDPYGVIGVQALGHYKFIFFTFLQKTSIF